MKNLTHGDIQALSLGAAILGSGGGGSPYLGKLCCEKVLDMGHELRLMAIDELPDNARVFSLCEAGSTSVMMEKIQAPEMAIAALRALEDHLDLKADALIPIEIGGGNGMVPLYIAGLLDMPVVDADGMGRALPELQMLTFDIYGNFDTVVAAIVNDHGQTQIIEAENQPKLEHKIRSLLVKLGGTAFLCQFSLSKAELKKIAIANTLSTALALGHSILTARAEKLNPFDAMLNFLNHSLYQHAEPLFSGTIVDVNRNNDGRFTTGVITIENQQEHYQITLQNENLIASHNSTILAQVPDLICVLDAETCEPLFSGEYRYGQRVRVIRIQAPAALSTPKALKVVGIEAFNLPR